MAVQIIDFNEEIACTNIISNGCNQTETCKITKIVK